MTTLPEYSENLQSFFNALAKEDWQQKAKDTLFIRDFEALPKRSNFDVDLLSNEDNWETLSAIYKEAAEKNNLICIVDRSETCLLFFLVDPIVAKDRRIWAYFEVRAELNIKEAEILKANDIDINYENGLPLPDKKWHFFLLFYQGIRKEKIEKYKATLSGMLKNNDGVSSACEEIYNISTDKIKYIIEGGCDVLVVKKELGIRYKLRQKENAALTTKTKIARWMFRNCYYAHISKPYFFSIHGPDGVGKTTTCATITEIFSQLPVAFESFHHITSWKRRHNAEIEKQQKEQKLPFYWGALRFIYRSLPESIKDVWLVTNGYHLYLKRLNKFLYSKFIESKVILVDRYIYDIIIKNRLHNMAPYIFHHIFGMLSRKPRIAFFMTDDAEKIATRKNELTVEEIKIYLKQMKTLLKRLNVNAKNIEVTGRTPEQIAAQIIAEIITNCDIEFINLMKTEVFNQSKQQEELLACSNYNISLKKAA